MTNGEKYTTAKERTVAFVKFCKNCDNCPLQKSEEIACRFAWLDLEAPMTAKEVADILAEHNLWKRGEGEYAEPGVWCPHTPKELSKAIDRAVEILRGL